MGLYDNIILGVYNISKAKVFEAPLLFTRYGTY